VRRFVRNAIQGGARNAQIEFNLANAYFRVRDLGRAVLHYRRAEFLAPADERVQANLRYVRERVAPHFDTAGIYDVTDRGLSVSRRMGVEIRDVAAVFGSALGWGLLLAWRKFRRRGLAIVALASILGGGACAAAAALDLERGAVHAVVIDEKVTLRRGRGDAYEPVLAEPLGGGVELRLLSERGDWYEVRLPDGRNGWLPASSVRTLSEER
jgi:hypothetical protein